MSMLGGALIAATVALAVVVLIDARRAGISYWATSLIIIVGFPIAVLTTGVSSWKMYWHGDRVVARWASAVTASLLVYFVCIAAMTWLVMVDGADGLLVGWVALEGLGGHVLPFILLQVTLLVARDRVAGAAGRRRPLVVFLLTVAALNLLIGAASFDPGPPLDGLQAPLAGTWVAALAIPQVTVPLWVAWLLSVLVGPIALWRAVGWSTGMARRRLSVMAVVSLLPVSTIACCVLVLPVLVTAEVPESVAVNVLFGFFVLGFSLTAAGLAAALDGRSDGLWLGSTLFQISVRVAVGLLFGLAAVTISTLMGLGFAGGSIPVVVLATVAVVALLWPLNHTLSRRLVFRADPRLATAAALVSKTKARAAQHPAQAARQVLRSALDDPNLQIAVRLPDANSWVSVEGDPLPAPDRQPAHHITPIPDGEGKCRAYVLHQTIPADAAPIVAEVLPLLDQAVLEVTVRHQAEQLADERARADRAAVEERRRLERDLHDGVQGRLLALAIDLQAADMSTRDCEAHLVLSDAVSSLRTAIEEVRRLASGSAPERLSRDGLGAALTDLVRRMPVPVSLNVFRGRLKPATEVIAYLVVSEAVTNAVKHGGSCAVDVLVAVDEQTLTIRVSDDGPGGADVRAGTGLRGLTERVNAAGGTLVVSDGSPRGTLLEVALPCAR
jgi:signal transduction histidine kinase